MDFTWNLLYSPKHYPCMAPRKDILAISTVEFDELEQPDSDLFTKLIAEYPIKFSIDQEHPMMKLLVNSGKKCSPKLIKHISIGNVKKVLKLYFVPEQAMKLSNKFLKSVDGCEQLSTNVLVAVSHLCQILWIWSMRYRLRSL